MKWSSHDSIYWKVGHLRSGLEPVGNIRGQKVIPPVAASMGGLEPVGNIRGQKVIPPVAALRGGLD